MAEIKLEFDEQGKGAFNLYENERKTGEMVLEISDGKLTVFHTEILPEGEGKGFARQMLNAMVAYAREHQLKVVPLCPYVLVQFERHQELYADLWETSK